MQLLNIPCKLA